MPDLETERALIAEGFALVAGVDEAGRGPLVGPVYAAAVIIPPDMEDIGLNDSKKLSAKKREALFDEIQSRSVAFGIAFASPAEIDELNILQASMLAMRRAVGQLSPAAQALIVDGNKCPGTGLRELALVKGDSKSCSVAAASILAKVSRDRVMEELDRLHPEYGFARHKGYPTAAHYEMIKKYGLLPEYRRTFLKTLDKHI